MLCEKFIIFIARENIYISSIMFPLCPLLKYEDRQLPMEVDIGGWLSIFYQFGSTCSGAGFCPANHPLAPAFTPRWVHPIRFAYYDTIYLHHCTRVDESRPTSRSFSPSHNQFFLFHRRDGDRDDFKNNFFNNGVTLRVNREYFQIIVENFITSY